MLWKRRAPWVQASVATCRGREGSAMADQKQLAILKQGPKAWNEWREKAAKIRFDLIRAYLSRTDFIGPNLTRAYLSGPALSRAVFHETIVSDADLSGCKGLESILHKGPSSVDIRTLQRSGPLPLAFLRGVGLPDVLIEYLPSLLGQAIQHYSCFIS